MSRAAQREQRRVAVLDHAARVLAAEGVAALTMRRIATEVGASTQVLYTLFGSKEGLVDALVEEGFRRFGDAVGQVYHPDPWQHLRELGSAYRRFALDNPDYYVLLWTGPRRPDPEDKTPGGEVAWQALVSAITRVMAALDRPAKDVEPVAMAIWAATHGFCALELTGVTGGDEAYDRLMRMCAAGIAGTS